METKYEIRWKNHNHNYICHILDNLYTINWVNQPCTCSFTFCYFTDIDECTTKTHKCHINAICANNNGSYDCTCRNGYTGDGFSCKGKWPFYYGDRFVEIFICKISKYNLFGYSKHTINIYTYNINWIVRYCRICGCVEPKIICLFVLFIVL